MPASAHGSVLLPRVWGVISVKKIVLACGAAAVALSLSACATVTRGTSQKFNIESSPDKAEVKLSNGQQCITPCQMKLKRKPGFTATVKKDGYQTQTITVDSKLGGGGAVAGAGNIILGGVIGGIVDGTNGSMNNLTPNPLKVTLVPVAAEAAPAVDAAPVADAAPASSTAETAPAIDATAPAPGGE